VSIVTAYRFAKTVGGHNSVQELDVSLAIIAAPVVVFAYAFL